MRWDKISGNASEIYVVLRGGIEMDNLTGTLVSDSGLESNTEYSYQVKARNIAGDGALSLVMRFTTSKLLITNYTFAKQFILLYFCSSKSSNWFTE